MSRDECEREESLRSLCLRSDEMRRLEQLGRQRGLELEEAVERLEHGGDEPTALL